MKDGKMYTGFTKDLKLRFEQHERGHVQSTKHRRPLELIYYEACLSEDDALHRERYLKTHYGKMFLKKRLKSYFTGWLFGGAGGFPCPPQFYGISSRMGEAERTHQWKIITFLMGLLRLTHPTHAISSRLTIIRRFLSMNFGVCIVKEALYGLARIKKRSVTELYLGSGISNR